MNVKVLPGLSKGTHAEGFATKFKVPCPKYHKKSVDGPQESDADKMAHVWTKILQSWTHICQWVTNRDAPIPIQYAPIPIPVSVHRGYRCIEGIGIGGIGD